jgi:predicted permease
MVWKWKRRRSADDFVREIRAHLAIEVERLIAGGMSPEDAESAARRTFGNVTRASERFHESHRLLWLDHLGHDVRSALRSLRKSPVTCAVALISLAGGIGSTTATLTVRDAVFYNAPPLYEDPAQLSRVAATTPERARSPVPAALFKLWSADRDLQFRIAAMTATRVADVRTADRMDAVRVRAVTPEFFAVLGVAPVLGRTFSPSLASAGPAPIVLSHRAWQNVFAGRPDVLGAVAWIDNNPHAVAGVMPERFWFSSIDGPIWTMVQADALPDTMGVDVVVRRPAGLTADALAVRLQRDAAEYSRALGDGSRRVRVLVSDVGGSPLADQLAIVIPPLVGAAVLLTLLIACANVAILMFARWTAREQEMAIRASLGATRGRGVRLLLTESLVLAGAGGVLGVTVTFMLRGLLVRNVPGAADVDLSLNWSILLQAAVVTLLTGILSGIAPALYETRRLQLNPLRLIAASDRIRQRWRHALVVLEITVTVALLVVAGSQIDAYRRTLASDVGFDTAPLLITRVENAAGVQTAAVVDLLSALPGVSEAAAGTAVPMASSGPLERVATDGGGSNAVTAERAQVSAAYFAALDVPIRAGRPFAARDMSAEARILIINERLAERLGRDGTPVGGSLWIENTPYEIVGIVPSYSASPLSRPSARFYLPLSDGGSKPTRMQFIVRATGDPRPLVQTIRRAIRGLGASYTVAAVYAVDDVVEAGAREILTLTYAMTPLLAMGLFLTATGIFGVLAFAFARRSKELALRVAIGATGRELVRMVTAHTLRLVGAGGVLGIATTFALTRLVQATGGAGGAFDTPGWEAFAIPVLIVFGVAGLAAWVPAWRALNINPAVLLRTD